MSDLPDWLATTLASDATGGEGVLDPLVRALRQGQRVVGRALAAGVRRSGPTWRVRGCGSSTIAAWLLPRVRHRHRNRSPV
jgi:hypothetical protein